MNFLERILAERKNASGKYPASLSMVIEVVLIFLIAFSIVFILMIL